MPVLELKPNGSGLPEPFGLYTAAAVEPSVGADVVEGWLFFHLLAQRLGLELAALGDLPGLDDDVWRWGTSIGRVIADDVAYDPYSGQPRMSNIPIRVTAPGEEARVSGPRR